MSFVQWQGCHRLTDSSCSRGAIGHETLAANEIELTAESPAVSVLRKANAVSK
jgi:hypothetical protein